MKPALLPTDFDERLSDAVGEFWGSRGTSRGRVLQGGIA